jgi:hypothetical protein
MQAVILCPTLPEVQGTPVVRLQLAWFSGHGVQEVVLVGRSPRLMEMGDGSEMGLRHLHASSPLEALPLLQPTFFLMTSSAYVPVDCEDSWREFRITPEPVLRLGLANSGDRARFLVLRKDAFERGIRGMDPYSLDSYVHAAPAVGTYTLTERYYEAETESGRSELSQKLAQKLL